MTDNKSKLQRMLAGLSNRDSGLGDAFKSVESEMKKVADKLREEANIQTVEESRKKIKELKEQIQLVLDSVENLKSDLGESEKNLSDSLAKTSESLKSVMTTMSTADAERAQVLSGEVEKLRSDIIVLSNQKVQIPDFASQIDAVQKELEKQLDEVEADQDQTVEQSKEHEKRLDKLESDLIDLRKKAMSALTDRGGSANRQINFNSSVMSTRYTDMNFLQAGNIGWSVSDDDVNRRVNISASILVGGSGSGTPGGANTQVQFNDSGAFGGETGLTYNKNTSVLGAVNVTTTGVFVGLKDKGSQVFNVKAYGATGDDSTDDTAAVQAAIDAMPSTGATLYFPAGTYRINSAALDSIPSASTIMGTGRGGSWIRSTTGTHNLFEFETGKLYLTFKSLRITTHSTGGHIFAPLGTFSQGYFQDIRAAQSNPAKSIWNQGDFSYFFNSWQDSYLFHAGATSVPAFDFTSATTAVHNANSFKRLTIEAEAGHATYFFDFATSAADYLYSNYFTDITAEITNGGVARVLSGNGFVFRNIDIFDLTTTVNSLFFLGAGAGSQGSRNNTFENINRAGGTLGASKYDIELQASESSDAKFINITKSNNSGCVVELNSNANIVIIECRGTTFNNKSVTTTTVGGGGITTPSIITGIQGSVAGTVGFSGRSTGLVTVQAPSIITTWTLTLPANDGTAGQYLLSDGSGITQWASVTAVGGSGITRTTSILSVSSTLADAASTDYMMFTNVGVLLTLPTAVGNSNLYTVKNMAASSVLVAAAAGEDIDGSATALLTTQYQALNFASNSSVWGVT